MSAANDRVMSVAIPIEHDELHGDLVVPSNAAGLVVFSNASGTGRRSTHNRTVAQALQRRGLATLLLDLLTADEEHADAVDAHLRFDIHLLARRLKAAVDWIERQPHLRHYPLGYFGAGTGSAAALMLAASRGREVRAVVSRNGWPELAGAALAQVHAPTLMIVGEADAQVLRLSAEALAQIPAIKQLATVAGATHFFEEPGAIDEVARLAGDWFTLHFAPRGPSVSTQGARV